MEAFFYWSGVMVWVLVALLLASMILIPLAQTVSYFTAQIAAVVVHKRWRCGHIRWHRLPDSFMRNWWGWVWNGPPDSITGPYMEWRGTFNWRVLPAKKG